MKQFQEDQTEVNEEPIAVVHAPKTTKIPKINELVLNPILSPIIPLLFYIRGKNTMFMDFFFC